MFVPGHFLFAPSQRIYFMGSGGIGMSGIEEIMLTMGYSVSGSDLKRSAVTDRLLGMGARIFEGHAASNAAASDVVVTSSAVAKNNPEVLEARERKIPVIQRGEMLGELMRLKYGIAVAGWQGTEAPASGVCAGVGGGGVGAVRRLVYTYGESADADFRLQVLEKDSQSHSLFEVNYKGLVLGKFRLHVPGRHNVLNATAAVAVGVQLGVAPDQIAVGLESFRGVDRRFQIKGVVRGVTVVDDYGHRPTEILATLRAARECGYGRVHVLFQPHRFTRTRDLMG